MAGNTDGRPADPDRCHELERENRHLRQLLARLSGARARIGAGPLANGDADSQKLELIGRLVGGIAHDFNNVLSVVMANAAMLEDDGAPPDEVRESLDNILAAGERGSMLVQKLLTFARAREVRPQVTQLNQAVDSVERFLRLLAGAGMAFRTEYGADAGAVEVDANQLDQVLMNLVVNARDACCEEGTITVRTGRFCAEGPVERGTARLDAGTYAFVTVADDGPGIAGDVLPYVFEPDFTTKGSGYGTGLGLATVRALVEQNRGHLALSTSSRGTTFEVLFPAADAISGIRRASAPTRRR